MKDRYDIKTLLSKVALPIIILTALTAVARGRSLGDTVAQKVLNGLGKLDSGQRDVPVEQRVAHLAMPRKLQGGYIRNRTRYERIDDDDIDDLNATTTVGPHLLNAAVLLNILLKNNASEEHLRKIYASNAEIVALQTNNGDLLWIEARFANDTKKKGFVSSRSVLRRWRADERIEVFVPTALAMLPLIGFWLGVLVER